MISQNRLHIIKSSILRALPYLRVAELTGKKLFITGGTGFFGYWLLSTLSILIDQGADIIVTVLSRDPQRFLKSQPHFRDLDWLSFAQGNVKDFDFSTDRYDLLIHAATDTSASAHANPLSIFDDIVFGSRHILDFAIHAGVKRVLVISSGAVYGPQPAGITCIPEDTNIACQTDIPSSAYGEGKRFMEMLATLYSQRFGLNVVSARCFAFVGPGLPLNAHFAIGNFIRDALWADEITVNSDGTPIRSYLYGGDLAVWLLTALINGKPGRIYNVGSDSPISVRDLAYLVRDTLCPDKVVRFLGQQDAGNGRNRYVPNIERARKELGLDVWTSLQEAIRLTAEASIINNQ